MSEKILIETGDITKLEVDAIVNAANTSLLGGGGVDGAIHRAAGKELLESCRALNGCRTGEAKITPGFKLPAKFIIHTPGPVWNGGHQQEDHLLASCYRNSLRLALENGIRSIAFPAISTGVYHFPKDRAARIAINEIRKFLSAHSSVEKVIFVCFDEEMKAIYEKEIQNS
jgi:O-acetyl-ADP-ribose deacetylase